MWRLLILAFHINLFRLILVLGQNIQLVFYPEKVNSEELQRADWTAILENFKKVVETI